MELVMAIIAACSVHTGTTYVGSSMTAQRECQKQLSECVYKELKEAKNDTLALLLCLKK
jgi:hypothetical protein